MPKEVESAVEHQMDRLTAQTRQFLRAAQAGPKLLAAVSGGADSVCLLLCAASLRVEGYQVSAVHVRHDLRDTAARDEAFVQALCEKLDVPFYPVSVRVPRTGSVENEARQVRYQAFGQIYRKTGSDALLLAHHRNDQAETVMMRLIRGCGAEGLSAMKPDSARGGMRILRPLLAVSADEIRSALRESGQEWREDETNQDPRYTRNYLRHRVVNPLEEHFPGSVGGICRTAELLAADNDFMSTQAEAALSDTACLEMPCRFLSRAGVLALHPALQRRVIRLFLSGCGRETGFDKTEEIRLALTDPPAAVNLDAGDRLLFSPERIHFVPGNPPEWKVPDGFFRTLPGHRTGDGKTVQAVPARLYPLCTVRFAREGDRFQPFGHQRSVPLSRFLIDRKIDRHFRAYIPLLCMENVVLWIPGVAASEQLRLRKEEDAVTLAVSGRLPWQAAAGEEI